MAPDPYLPLAQQPLAPGASGIRMVHFVGDDDPEPERDPHRHDRGIVVLWFAMAIVVVVAALVLSP